jgi:hypothetical protein
VVCFFEILTPYLGVHNFFISNPFLTIVNVLDALRKEVQVLVWTPETMKPSPWIQPALNA